MVSGYGPAYTIHTLQPLRLLPNTQYEDAQTPPPWQPTITTVTQRNDELRKSDMVHLPDDF